MLPAEQRYTSLKFRRLSSWVYATQLDYPDAAELVAFVQTVGHKPARWIFHWPPHRMRELRKLTDHLGAVEDVVRMVAENNEAPTRADGLATLRAMQEGGFTIGTVPPVVRLALLDMRDAGMTYDAIAAQLGVTRDQARVMANGHRVKPRLSRLTGLVAA